MKTVTFLAVTTTFLTLTPAEAVTPSPAPPTATPREDLRVSAPDGTLVPRAKRAPQRPNLLAKDPVDPVWDALAVCESGMGGVPRWDYNGSSGFDGGLQFHPKTWSAFRPQGHPEYAWQATREQQVEVAKKVREAQGWNAWPTCARKLGLI